MMLPRSALPSMKVMFATPCYISAVSMNYVTSLYSLAYACAHEGMVTMLQMRSESLITRARNRMLKVFLQEESFTHLFWIDSDIAFTPDQVFRLLLANRDVASGVYPLKLDYWPAEGLPAGMTGRSSSGATRNTPSIPSARAPSRCSDTSTATASSRSPRQRRVSW